jgi:hypothetical protein
MEKQPPRPAGLSTRRTEPIVERRKGERRVNKDRRNIVRFEKKDDRRKRGINSDRRKGNIWGGGRG